MSATSTHPATARGRTRPQGAAMVSMEHIMALAAELHRCPPALARGPLAPRTPVRISAEEWALLFPSWPGAPVAAAA